MGQQNIEKYLLFLLLIFIVSILVGCVNNDGRLTNESTKISEIGLTQNQINEFESAKLLWIESGEHDPEWMKLIGKYNESTALKICKSDLIPNKNYCYWNVALNNPENSKTICKYINKDYSKNQCLNLRSIGID